MKRLAKLAPVLLAALGVADEARAEEGVQFSFEYVADYVAGLSGEPGRTAEFLDHLDVSAAFDLERLAGWRGTTLFVHALNNSGGAPNDELATLQGIDNIEVTRQRARLYELWIETSIAGLNVRGGLYDLNSEFYVNEAAGLLIAPAFGIGSELAATGPNGPSIFPSTAIAVRVAAPVSEHGIVRAAVLNAEAGVPGDPGGVDTTFEGDALVILEWAWSGETSFALGAWRYTDEQDDIRLTDIGGDPIQQTAAGFYATVERELWPNATAFGRVGVADGDTTPYVGGWQAGLLFDGALPARPESQISIGVYQGRLSAKYRDNLRDGGVDAGEAETGFELTYSDQVTPWLRIQPDLQIIHNPSGEASRDDLVVGVLRMSISL